MKNYLRLPDKWVVKITEENREILNNWKKTTSYTNDLFHNRQYKYVDNIGAGVTELSNHNTYKDYHEISMEEFMIHVLNSEPVEEVQNYDYLIPILNNIKN